MAKSRPRSKSIAMLVSAGESKRRAARRPDLWDMVREFRDRVVREAIELDDTDFVGLRDRGPGRDVKLR